MLSSEVGIFKTISYNGSGVAVSAGIKRTKLSPTTNVTKCKIQ